MTGEATTYSVYWDDEVVLVVRDEPGILISRSAAPPPPGTPPAMHPFLTGTAYLPEHEGTLREALERSSDFDGLVESWSGWATGWSPNPPSPRHDLIRPIRGRVVPGCIARGRAPPEPAGPVRQGRLGRPVGR